MRSSIVSSRLRAVQLQTHKHFSTTSQGLSPPAYAGMASDVPGKLSMDTRYKMQSGFEMPVLGYGVYQTPASECEAVTVHAFKTGYRHVDSARVYRNEQPCADAIRASGIPREQIFFTSKVPPRDMGYERTTRAIEASFKQTGLDYIDLYLIHSPYGGKEARCGTWKALVEAKKAGKIRSLGISNYGVHHLDELSTFISSSTDTSIKSSTIDVGQWELHPWLPHDDIVSWSRERNVIVQAWSPLVRSERSHEPILKELGEKHGKTWAQVLIRWSLQKGFVPLPKSVTPKRIEENADVWDFELDEGDMQKLEFKGSYEPCSWDPTVSND